MSRELDLYVLALETAVGSGSVAVFKNRTPFAPRRGITNVSRASELLPAIRDILGDTGLPLGSLSTIVVGAGPGSFTGIRIAISTAMGLAAPFDIPVKLVSTLDAIAAFSDSEDVVAALPLGRERICVQRYLRQQNTLNAAAPPEVVNEAEFGRQLAAGSTPFVVNDTLYQVFASKHKGSLINCGEDLARYLGIAYIEKRIPELDAPLFVGQRR